MFKLSQTENQIQFKPNASFLGVAVVAVGMAVVGFNLLIGLLPLEQGYTFADVFGVAFVCCWVLVVLGTAFYSLNTASKKITIDREGVCSKSWFKTEAIRWTDIQDWGLSYCGQTRYEGNTYYLYFSVQEHQIKNECTKKLKGKMIKVIVVGDEYKEVVDKVLPFCMDKTYIKPFVGKDKFHFI